MNTMTLNSFILHFKRIWISRGQVFLKSSNVVHPLSSVAIFDLREIDSAAPYGIHDYYVGLFCQEKYLGLF